MGKSFFEEAEEAKGGITTPLTGALVEIVSFERTKTKEKGLRMYVEEVKIVEPKKFKGLTVRDWIVVGTEEDPLAKRPETWARSEGGPGRLKRVLVRSGTPLSDDDEEWMEAAEGRQYVTPVRVQLDDDGTPRARLGLAFRPSDEDCPEIGEAEGEAAKPAKAGKKKSKGAAAAAQRVRGKGKPTDDDEDETDTPDEDEDEKPKKGKKAAKPTDDEDEDDEDEKPAKGKGKKPADDDDDDEEN